MWHLGHLGESFCSLVFIVLYAQENYFVSHINVFNLYVVNFFCFSSHFHNMSLKFCFILYDFVTFIWGMCIVVRSGSIWIVMFIAHIYHICKCAGRTCFSDPVPAGKYDPGSLYSWPIRHLSWPIRHQVWPIGHLKNPRLDTCQDWMGTLFVWSGTSLDPSGTSLDLSGTLFDPLVTFYVLIGHLAEPIPYFLEGKMAFFLLK